MRSEFKVEFDKMKKEYDAKIDKIQKDSVARESQMKKEYDAKIDKNQKDSVAREAKMKKEYDAKIDKIQKDSVAREGNMKKDYEAKMKKEEKEIHDIKNSQTQLTSKFNTFSKKDLNYKTINPIKIGDYNFNKTTFKYDLGKHIPSSATEVLINVFLYSGRNRPERQLTCKLSVGDKHYNLYIYAFDQNAYSFDNNMMWIPVDKSKALSFSSTGQRSHAQIYIAGYR
eukprot:CAMPEP_0170519224 /NCGR_PEP_ID=MMETSP0209-20121228/4723_1 /TAXON_ID=665100 ORGANISM="Litonotus pictus, Strain P1" /NCGR_SAMPLE_ID=MMETSP0209 /ASSEMBLY_ACC=CAM_ASM_000301 /LENGTH=226 /DNA_ID=CAMNT_0010805061 /DNA_START=124 /DNA_END=804 /DNA_ORIENTATION=-